MKVQNYFFPIYMQIATYLATTIANNWVFSALSSTTLVENQHKSVSLQSVKPLVTLLQSPVAYTSTQPLVKLLQSLEPLAVNIAQISSQNLVIVQVQYPKALDVMLQVSNWVTGCILLSQAADPHEFIPCAFAKAYDAQDLGNIRLAASYLQACPAPLPHAQLGSQTMAA